MEWYWIFLILAVAVMVFGFGVVLANRRRAGRSVEPGRPSPRPVPPPPEQLPPGDDRGDTLVAEPEPPVEVPPAPPSLRDRLAKARTAFTGVFAGVLGRSAITDETWNDLEEALLRADVGLGVTDALLDDLKQRVARPADHRAERVARRPASRHGRPPAWLGSHDPLRRLVRAGLPERVDVRRRQRCRQDHHDRQARSSAGRRRTLGAVGGG